MREVVDGRPEQTSNDLERSIWHVGAWCGTQEVFDALANAVTNAKQHAACLRPGSTQWHQNMLARGWAGGDKLGPPTPPHPLSLMGLVGTASDMSPFGAAADLASAIDAGSRAKNSRELLSAAGGGLFAAMGMAPNVGPLIRSVSRARALARTLPAAATPTELLTVDQALRLRPITVTADDAGIYGILRDRQFKSQFETGHSGGLLAPDLRRRVEAEQLGVPLDTPDAQRPIYGALGMAPGMRNIEQYGNHTFILKPDVKQRSTYTLGDSLDDLLKGKPWDRRGSDKLATKAAHPYIEAQISRPRQPLRLNDVDRVLMTRPNATAYRALDREGIPYDLMPDQIARNPGSPEWVNWWRQFGLTAPPVTLGGLWATAGQDERSW